MFCTKIVSLQAFPHRACANSHLINFKLIQIFTWSRRNKLNFEMFSYNKIEFHCVTFFRLMYVEVKFCSMFFYRLKFQVFVIQQNIICILTCTTNIFISLSNSTIVQFLVFCLTFQSVLFILSYYYLPVISLCWKLTFTVVAKCQSSSVCFILANMRSGW